MSVPESLVVFSQRPDLQRRIHSVTACYLDLGDFVVEPLKTRDSSCTFCPTSNGADTGSSTATRPVTTRSSPPCRHSGSRYPTTGRTHRRRSFLWMAPLTWKSVPTPLLSFSLPLLDRERTLVSAAPRHAAGGAARPLRSWTSLGPIAVANHAADVPITSTCSGRRPPRPAVRRSFRKERHLSDRGR
jgi:hypothetical protein